MNEHLDRLLLKLILAVFICALILLYRFLHRILYPSSQFQLATRFHPEKNAADTVHLFSRILGIGIIYSSLQVDSSNGVLLGMLDLGLISVVGFMFYLGSLYILESVSLYRFEYYEEIHKKKNMSYAIICFAQSFGVSLVISTILSSQQKSIPILLTVWLSAIVLLGLSVNTYKWLSRIVFHKAVVQKNLSVAFSYGGFLIGACVVLSASYSMPRYELPYFLIQVVLNVIKVILVFPIFQKGLIWIFKIDDKFTLLDQEVDQPPVAVGIYEGILFLTACLLSTVVTQQIYFGNFYPSLN